MISMARRAALFPHAQSFVLDMLVRVGSHSRRHMVSRRRFGQHRRGQMGRREAAHTRTLRSCEMIEYGCYVDNGTPGPKRPQQRAWDRAFIPRYPRPQVRRVPKPYFLFVTVVPYIRCVACQSGSTPTATFVKVVTQHKANVGG